MDQTIFMLLLWWMVWFWISIEVLIKARKKITLFDSVAIFLLSGFTPIVTVFMLIHRFFDKRGDK